MKRFFIITALTIIMPTYATTMCAQNDTVAVILDPSINSTNRGSDGTTYTWWMDFPYGRIHGIARCTDGNSPDTEPPVGKACWCKITHPVATSWFFQSTEGAVSTCTNGCAGFCGFGLSGVDKRRSVFGSISN